MKALRPLAALGLLFAVLAGGIWLGGHPSHLPSGMRELLVDDTGTLSAEAAGLIESNYFREVSPEQLNDASISGMVRSISRENDDRFSHYFDPEAVQRFNEAISGSFTGVGLSVVEVPRGLRVGRVFAGTPAAQSGIEVGEVIVSVDGEGIAGQRAEAVTTRIKGPEGSSVTLGVAGPGGGDPRQVDVVRREIRLPPTRTSMRQVGGTKLGYLQLVTFSQRASEFLRGGVERLRENGAEGIVIDLRGNGGGLLSEAILAASVFIDEGETVVSTRSRSEGEQVYQALGGNLPEGPVTVLINRDTASAAEILAAALNEDLEAPLVGTRSYGKGVFQKVIDLSNGGALDLTIGEYFTASGVSLAGRGLEPDVRAVDDPETEIDEALRRALRVLRDEVRDSADQAET